MDPRHIMEQIIIGSQQHGGMPTTHIHSVSQLFVFVGLLVCIGAIGIYAMYKIFKDLF